MMATRKEGSASYHVRRVWASQWPRVGMEFIARGRLMVMRRICSSGKETRKVDVLGGGLASFVAKEGGIVVVADETTE